jgi:hypothetical protein
MDVTKNVHLKFVTWIVAETSLKGGHVWVYMAILVFQVGFMSNSVFYARFLRRPLEITTKSNFSRTYRKHYEIPGCVAEVQSVSKCTFSMCVLSLIVLSYESERVWFWKSKLPTIFFVCVFTSDTKAVQNFSCWDIRVDRYTYGTKVDVHFIYFMHRTNYI